MERLIFVIQTLYEALTGQVVHSPVTNNHPGSVSLANLELVWEWVRGALLWRTHCRPWKRPSDDTVLPTFVRPPASIITWLANLIINTFLSFYKLLEGRAWCQLARQLTLLCFFYYSTLGENFDRQASLRRSLIYTDTLVRRPKKVKRRKTISGIPDIIQKELGTVHQHCILLSFLAAPIYRTNLMWFSQFHTFPGQLLGEDLGEVVPVQRTCFGEEGWGGDSMET